MARARNLASDLSGMLRNTRTTVAVAESLSGGLLSSHLAAAPDASTWFRGAVVAYSVEVKQRVLGVPPGPVVTGECALSMAGGVARLLRADLAVAVTGVGGPDSEEGKPPGTVYSGLWTAGGASADCSLFPGDPEAVVIATTVHGLELLLKGALSLHGS